MIITGKRNKIVKLSVCQWEFDETNNKIEMNNSVKEISYEIVCEHDRIAPINLYFDALLQDLKKRE